MCAWCRRVPSGRRGGRRTRRRGRRRRRRGSRRRVGRWRCRGRRPSRGSRGRSRGGRRCVEEEAVPGGVAAQHARGAMVRRGRRGRRSGPAGCPSGVGQDVDVEVGALAAAAGVTCWWSRKYWQIWVRASARRRDERAVPCRGSRRRAGRRRARRCRRCRGARAGRRRRRGSWRGAGSLSTCVVGGRRRLRRRPGRCQSCMARAVSSTVRGSSSGTSSVSCWAKRPRWRGGMWARTTSSCPPESRPASTEVAEGGELGEAGAGGDDPGGAGGDRRASWRSQVRAVTAPWASWAPAASKAVTPRAILASSTSRAASTARRSSSAVDVEVEPLDRFHQRSDRSQQGTQRSEQTYAQCKRSGNVFPRFSSSTDSVATTRLGSAGHGCHGGTAAPPDHAGDVAGRARRRARWSRRRCSPTGSSTCRRPSRCTSRPTASSPGATTCCCSSSTPSRLDRRGAVGAGRARPTPSRCASRTSTGRCRSAAVTSVVPVPARAPTAPSAPPGVPGAGRPRRPGPWPSTGAWRMRRAAVVVPVTGGVAALDPRVPALLRAQLPLGRRRRRRRRRGWPTPSAVLGRLRPPPGRARPPAAGRCPRVGGRGGAAHGARPRRRRPGARTGVPSWPSVTSEVMAGPVAPDVAARRSPASATTRSTTSSAGRRSPTPTCGSSTSPCSATTACPVAGSPAAHRRGDRGGRGGDDRTRGPGPGARHRRASATPSAGPGPPAATSCACSPSPTTGPATGTPASASSTSAPGGWPTRRRSVVTAALRGATLRRIVGADDAVDDPDVTAGYAVDWTGRWRGATPRRRAARRRPTRSPRSSPSCRGARRRRSCRRAATPASSAAACRWPARSCCRCARLDAHHRRRRRRRPADRRRRRHDRRRAGRRRRGRAGPTASTSAARDSATVGGTRRHQRRRARACSATATPGPSSLGVEAVLGDGVGRVATSAGSLKDNTGYHLPSLLCGSEGTLGVVTAARLRLVPRYEQRVVALVGVGVDGRGRGPRRAACAATVADVDAIEFLTAACRQLVGLPPPLGAGSTPVYVLVECAGHDDPTAGAGRRRRRPAGRRRRPGRARPAGRAVALPRGDHRGGQRASARR